MKKYFIGVTAILAISAFLGPVFVQSSQQPGSVPGTFNEIQQRGQGFFGSFPGAITQIWHEVWARIQNVWYSYVKPWVMTVWNKIVAFFNSEVEKRKPSVEAEFQKEKQQMKQDIKVEVPKIGKDIWQRIKELVR